LCINRRLFAWPVCEGVKMEQDLLAIASKYTCRIIGPNGLGLIDTGAPLNASFAAGTPTSRIHATFMSHRARCAPTILDPRAWLSISAFPHFVSLGNKADN
jgi:acetyltransferase